MSKNTTIIIIVVVVLLLIGAGVGYYFYSKNSVAALIKISVSPSTQSIMKGTTFQFTAKVTDEKNQLVDKAVVWSVSDTTKGSISDSGLFSAKSDSGSVKVTATLKDDKNKMDSATIALKPEDIGYITQNNYVTDAKPLYSPNRDYYATTDPATGKLCVKKVGGADKWCSDWSDTATGNKHFTVMQIDGNLCTYRGTNLENRGEAVGCTYKFAPQDTQPNNYLKLSNDGNLCVYPGTPSQAKEKIWCSS